MPRIIQRTRLADQAYEVLRERILTGSLAAGARLSVPALAEELELSRSPVREAVQRLVQEGLGTERPHSGAVVATPDLASLAALYEVRAVLEGLSAESAARSGDEGLVADLERLHAAHAKAFRRRSHAAVIEADIAFHRRILVAAGNPELTRVLAPILERMALAMAAGELTSWPEEALAEHEAVLDALRAGEAPRARRAMVGHVTRVRKALLGKLREG